MEKWGAIKQSVKGKKEQWAQREARYTGYNVWGDEYGFTLAEPYTLEEVEKYEALSGIQLPLDLKEYLIFVSRELFTDSYPVIFDLKALCSLNDEQPFSIAENEDWSNEPCQCKDDCEHSFSDGTLRIGYGGCTDHWLIVLRGTQLGTVWLIMSGGDAIMRTHNSFAEYIGLK